MTPGQAVDVIEERINSTVGDDEVSEKPLTANEVVGYLGMPEECPLCPSVKHDCDKCPARSGICERAWKAKYRLAKGRAGIADVIGIWCRAVDATRKNLEVKKHERAGKR